MNAVERSELCLASMKALHESVCWFEKIGGSKEMFQAGNISPMELNKKIEEYAEIMEQLGALEG